MAYLIKGILHNRGIIKETPSKKGDKVFRSQEVVLKQPRIDQYTGEEYAANFVVFEAQNEIIDALMGFNEGDVIEVEFFPRGTEYQNRAGELAWFSRLNIRSATLVRAAAPQRPAPQKEVDDLPDGSPDWMRD